MQGLIMAAQLITALSILVTIHELGHYWAARAFGIKVEKFYLFFDAWGFKLFKFKKGDTEFGIGWLPLGGYVKIAGMIDESMDTEQMKREPQPWEFRSKPAWQRLIVMVGGVVLNIVLGVVIFAMLAFHYGETRVLNSSIKYGIVPSAYASQIGFQKGDKIVAVNGKPILHFEEILNPKEILKENAFVSVSRNQEIIEINLPADFIAQMSSAERADFLTPRRTFKVGDLQPGYNADKAGVLPGDQIISVNETPIRFFDDLQEALAELAGQTAALAIVREADTLLMDVKVDNTGKIGIGITAMELEFDKIKYGFFESFPKGVNRGVETISLQLKGFGKIFSGDIPANKALNGPIGIARFYGGEWIWERFWTFTALISLVLAFMNMLPIPALDGGHVVLLLIEMVMGQPIKQSIVERIQTVGFFILMALTVFVFGNDIIQLFVK
jgi:regulator of sigma E protease